ncbi:YALIA101S03e14136g1_1 [Yarrowia lipolytica]|nr:Hypothetical protein YALI2_E00597g [Yarrowia lipolytica]SEI33261.1 YALIA101S03e14136g1_1 [Yarrowia lipolytica]
MNLFSCFQNRKTQTGSTTPTATAARNTPKENTSSAGSDEKHTLETIAEGPETTSPYKASASRGDQVPGTPKSELGGYSFTPPALKVPPPVAGHKHISSPNETGSPYLPTSPSFKTSPRIDVDLESRMSTFNPYSLSPPSSADNNLKTAPSLDNQSLASGLGLGIPNLNPSPPVTPVKAHPLSNEVKMDMDNGSSPPVPEKDHPRTLRPKSLHGSQSASNNTRQASPPKMEPIPRPRQIVDSPSFTSSYSPTMAPRISMSFARQSRLIPLDVLKNFSSDDFLGDFLKDTSFRESMDASMLSSGVPGITDRATNRQTFASSHYSEYYEDNPDLQLELSRMRSMSRQASLHHKDSRSNRTSQYTTYNPNDEYEAYDHDKLARELAREIEGASRESCDPGKPNVNRLSTVAASENSGGVSVPPSDFGSPRSEIHRERTNNNNNNNNNNITQNNHLTTSHSNNGADGSNFTHDSISTSNSMNTMSNMTSTTANTTINSIGETRDSKSDVKTVPGIPPHAKTSASATTTAPTMPPSPPVSMRESIKDLPNYTVTHSYRPILEDEIEVRRGDTVKICQEFDDGWCLVTIVKMRSDDPENRRSIGSTMGYKEGVCPRACLALEV